MEGLICGDIKQCVVFYHLPQRQLEMETKSPNCQFKSLCQVCHRGDQGGEAKWENRVSPASKRANAPHLEGAAEGEFEMLRSRWSFSSLPPLRASRGKDGVGRGRREGKEPQKESPKECGVFEREGDQQPSPWLDLLG